jgi:hypothetical protein
MSLGKWLDITRKRHATRWTLAFFSFSLVWLWLTFHYPHHPEYHYDIYPGFWAVFGLFVALVMVIVMKKIVYPLITGPEDSSDDR